MIRQLADPVRDDDENDIDMEFEVFKFLGTNIRTPIKLNKVEKWDL